MIHDGICLLKDRSSYDWYSRILATQYIQGWPDRGVAHGEKYDEMEDSCASVRDAISVFCLLRTHMIDGSNSGALWSDVKRNALYGWIVVESPAEVS